MVDLIDLLVRRRLWRGTRPFFRVKGNPSHPYSRVISRWKPQPGGAPFQSMLAGLSVVAICGGVAARRRRTSPPGADKPAGGGQAGRAQCA